MAKDGEGRLGYERASPLREIIIILTYQCPAECGHCIFESDPTRTETVEIESAKRLIEAAARQDRLPALGFSGGDPFLRLGMMKELAAFAQERGMVSQAVSSSAWCRDYDHARRVLRELKDVGLVTYSTSVSRYHLDYVSPDKLRAALRASLDLGLRTVVNTLVERDLLEAEQAAPEDLGDEGSCANKTRGHLARVLGLDADTIGRLKLFPALNVPVGKARAGVTGFVQMRAQDLQAGCPFSIESVTLSPAGLLYPCPGAVLGEDPSQAALYVQGSLAARSPDEVAALLDALTNNPYFRLLNRMGPARLLDLVKRRNPSIALPDTFAGACDACLQFTRNKEVSAAMRDLLRQWPGGPPDAAVDFL